MTKVLGYLVIGFTSLVVQDRMGISNTASYRQAALSVLLWPLNWLLLGVSYLTDEDQ